MKKAYLICTLGCLVSLAAFGKEDCWGAAQLLITHANGEIEVPDTYGTPTIVLEEADSATIQFGYTSGYACSDPRFLVWRNGGLIVDVPAFYIDVDVTASGFYDSGGSGMEFFGSTGPFYITHSVAPPVLLDVKAWLQGPFEETMGLMRDDLRAVGALYTLDTIPPTAVMVISLAGPNALVDFVFVELRSANSPQTVIETQYAMLQRDGDIVSMAGIAPLHFSAPAGEYYVVVGHRNHLRAMTATPISLGNDPVTLDFRDPAFPTYGNEARKIEGDAALLWAGKASWRPEISYTGPDNDRDAILQAVGSDPTHIVAGYSNADVNMDGVVKYTGPDNDRDIILMNLGDNSPSTVREEQVP